MFCQGLQHRRKLQVALRQDQGKRQIICKFFWPRNLRHIWLPRVFGHHMWVRNYRTSRRLWRE